MRRYLLLVLLVALAASACAVDPSQIQPVVASAAVAPTEDAPAVLAAVDEDAVAMTTIGQGSTSIVYSDPAGAMSPSQRCGFDGPTSIGRIGLDPDIAVAAPAEYFNSLAITEPLPDSAATTSGGLLCVVVHDEPEDSVSCGLAGRGSGVIEVRRQPLLVTFVRVNSESPQEAIELPKVKLWDPCNDTADRYPLEEKRDAARSIETTRALVTKQLLAPYVETLDVFLEAHEASQGDLGDADCAVLHGLIDGQRAVGEAVLASLGIDDFWQPVPTDAVPSLGELAVLTGTSNVYAQGVADEVAAAETIDPAVAQIVQLADDANARWASFGDAQSAHAERDDARYGAHVAWKAGELSSAGFDSFELASLTDAVMEARCPATSSDWPTAAIDARLVALGTQATLTDQLVDETGPAPDASAGEAEVSEPAEGDEAPENEETPEPDDAPAADVSDTDQTPPAVDPQAERATITFDASVVPAGVLSAQIADVQSRQTNAPLDPQQTATRIAMPQGWTEFVAATPASAKQSSAAQPIPPFEGDRAGWCSELHETRPRPTSLSVRGWSEDQRSGSVMVIITNFETAADAQASVLRHNLEAQECSGIQMERDGGAFVRNKRNVEGLSVHVMSVVGESGTGLNLRVSSGSTTATVGFQGLSADDGATPTKVVKVMQAVIAALDAQQRAQG